MKHASSIALPRLVEFFGRRPATTRGTLLMIGACACFAGLIVAVRQASEELHPLQTTFFRNLFSSLFLLAWFVPSGFGAMRTRRFGLHFLRATIGFAAMASLFAALGLMPLAEATALTFTTPLFGTIGAALVFKEGVGLRRWTATLVGFMGVLIILRPGTEAFSPAAFVALASAAFAAGAMLAIKALSRTEKSITIVMYFHFLVTPLSLLPALPVWEAPSLDLWKWLVLVGFLATVGQLFMTQAFSTTEVSVLLPLEYLQLVFVAVLAYVFYAEVPGPAVWLGSLVIFAPVVYMARHEDRKRRNHKFSLVSSAEELSENADRSVNNREKSDREFQE